MDEWTAMEGQLRLGKGNSNSDWKEHLRLNVANALGRPNYAWEGNCDWEGQLPLGETTATV